MDHHCDIIVFDPPRDRVLVERTAHAWILPFAFDRARLRPTHLVHKLLAGLGGKWYVATLGPSWLSTRPPLLYSWALTLAVNRMTSEPVAPFEWMAATDALKKLTLPLQRRSLASWRHLAGANLCAVAGGTIDWLPSVSAWTREQVARTTHMQVEPVEPAAQYRVPPDRIVLAFDGDSEHGDGRVYFKAFRRGGLEYELAACLAAVAPSNVPATRAFDRTRRWWLIDPAPGRAMSEQITYADAECAVRGLADTQRKTRQHLSALAARHRPLTLSWERVARELNLALALVAEGNPDALADDVLDTIRRTAQSTGQAFTGWKEHAWVETDLDPRNIFVDGQSPCFIDLEGSYVGFPPLAVEGFLVRLEELEPAALAWADSLRRAYAQEWKEAAIRTGYPLEWPRVRAAFRFVQMARRLRHTRAKVRSGRLIASLGSLVRVSFSALERQLAGLPRIKRSESACGPTTIRPA